MRDPKMMLSLLHLLLILGNSYVCPQPLTFDAHEDLGSRPRAMQTRSDALSSYAGTSPMVGTKDSPSWDADTNSSILDDLTNVFATIDGALNHKTANTISADDDNILTVPSLVNKSNVSDIEPTRKLVLPISTPVKSRFLHFLPFLGPYYGTGLTATFPFIEESSPITETAITAPAQGSTQSLLPSPAPSTLQDSESTTISNSGAGQNKTMTSALTTASNEGQVIPPVESGAISSTSSPSPDDNKNVDTSMPSILQAIKSVLAGASEGGTGAGGFALVPITANGVKGIAILPVGNSSTMSTIALAANTTNVTPNPTEPPKTTTVTSSIPLPQHTATSTADSSVPTLPVSSSVPAAPNTLVSGAATPQVTQTIIPPATPNNFDNGAQHTINKTPLGSGRLASGIASSLEASAINPDGVRIDGALPVMGITLLVPSIGTIRVVG